MNIRDNIFEFSIIVDPVFFNFELTCEKKRDSERERQIFKPNQLRKKIIEVCKKTADLAQGPSMNRKCNNEFFEDSGRGVGRKIV